MSQQQTKNEAPLRPAVPSSDELGQQIERLARKTCFISISYYNGTDSFVIETPGKPVTRSRVLHDAIREMIDIVGA